MRLPFARKASADDPAPAGDASSDLHALRTRARRRLMGALVLLIAAVVGFPLMFETQPRPAAGTVAIDTGGLVVKGDLPEAGGAAVATERNTPTPGPAAAPAPAPAPPGPASAAAVLAGSAGATAASSPAELKSGAVGTMAAAAAGGAVVAAAATEKAKSAKDKSNEKVVTAKAALDKAVVEKAGTDKAAGEKVAIDKAAKVTAPPAPPASAAKAGVKAASLPKAAVPAPKASAPAAAASAPAVDPAGARFVVQVGAYTDLERMKQTRQTVERMGFKTYISEVETPSGKRTRLRLGPFETKKAAEAAAAKLKAAGMSSNILAL